MKILRIFLTLLLGIPLYASVPAGKIIDWSNVGVRGNITNRSTVFVTLNPGASAETLNADIQACPTNQIIVLTAGDYYFDQGIQWQGGGLHGNYITLRGAGSANTRIHFTNASYSGDGYFWLRGSDAFDERGQGYLVITGLTRGSTNFTLNAPISDMPPPQPDDILWLDQIYNTNDITPIGWGESTPAHAMLNRGNDPAGYRIQLQAFNIYSISGTSLMTTEPVYMNNWDTTHAAQFFRGALHGAGAKGIGFEGFSVYSNTNDNMGAVFAFEWANDCWINDVSSFWGGNFQHVDLGNTKNCSVINSYFYGSQSSGSDAYGVEVDESTDFLYQNNILNAVTTPIFVDCGSSGCVIAYNYITNVFYDGGFGWFAQGLGPSHGAHPTMNLYEGNVCLGIVFDNVHGSSSDQTVFRNYSPGFLAGSSVNTYAIMIQAHGERENIIGNILGTDGYHTNYEDTCNNLANSVKSIYMLGYWGNFAFTNGTPYTWGFYTNDPGVVSSIYRDGNFDYATHSTIWDSSDSDHILPSSLYLTSKPSWFGSVPYPPIGSDASPLVSSIPAQIRFQNMTPPAVATNSTVISGTVTLSGGVTIH